MFSWLIETREIGIYVGDLLSRVFQINPFPKYFPGFATNVNNLITVVVDVLLIKMRI